MTEQDSLNVWYEETLVGRLWRDARGSMGFSYDRDWQAHGFAISQQLPLEHSEYQPETGEAHQFFTNLLPEADARLHLIRDLKISNSDFELLKVIGGECAGALSMLLGEEKPGDIKQYKELSGEEFTRILKRRGQISNYLQGEDRPRLSLAGAQDKFPIYLQGEKYLLPVDAAPSTHILKFEISGYRNVPLYEYFLMELGKAVGLNIVDVELCQHNKNEYLLIQRYDRSITSNKIIKRLHQEDFCQALGLSFEKKYQKSGGPSFADCIELIRNVATNPIQDAEMLIRWQIFNVLAGNSDGHAKNLSLLYKPNNQLVLAPFYDLVCTRAIERIDTHLAMAVGGEYNPDLITMKNWNIFANECHVSEGFVKKLIQEMSELLLENINSEAFQRALNDHPALQRVKSVITKQCKRALSFK